MTYTEAYRLVKEAASAKGIPDRAVLGDLASLPVGVPLDFVRQQHLADKAGPHEDFRVGNEKGMFSWAIPKGLPENPGKPRLAIQQPLHDYSYNNFEGTIPEGYGKGTVSRIDKGQLVILEKTPDKMTFTRGDRRNSPLYTMVKGKDGKWMVLQQKGAIPPAIMGYQKLHFKPIEVSAVPSEMDKDMVASPKIDGSGAVVTVMPDRLDVYGVRKDKYGNPIRYTDYIGGMRGLRNPPDIAGRSFRAELTGVRGSKLLEPQELSGILNSNLGRSLLDQAARKIKLRLMALAPLDGGENYRDQETVNKLVSRLNHPSVLPVPLYNKEQALEALRQMRAGNHPLTREGLVLYGKGVPEKAKLLKDNDVVIRSIFPAVTKGTPRAGGFEYSLPDSSQPVGRVGTGFRHALLKDMLANPDLYIGRIARIKSRGQYGSGAYRAPSFISLHEG